MKRWFDQFFPSMTIGQIVLFLSVTVMAFAIVVMVNLSYLIQERAISDLAREEARQTSQLVFESLYSAMKKGWTKEEIESTIDRLDRSFEDMSINVYRSHVVSDLFGENPGEKERIKDDQAVFRALNNAEEQLISHDDKIRFLYPIVAQEECLVCHTNSQVGAVHGVIDIAYPVNNLKISLDYISQSIIVYFTLIFLVIFLLLYFQLKFLIAKPITGLATVMSDIIDSTDLTKRVEGKRSMIAEVRNLSDYFNKLLRTIQEYHGKVEEYSVKDPMTGLYNRRKFEEFIEHEIHRSNRHNHTFSIVILDLDNFKHVNDMHGHPIGDLALKEIAETLTSSTRRTDMIARLGADEFAILLPEASQSRACEMAELLRTRMEESALNFPAGKTRVLGSFGVVTFPMNGETPAKLAIAMDVAMYKAKRLGKNRVCTIDDSDEESARRSFSKAQFLQEALDEDRVEPYFQPIMDAQTGKPYAYEALARIRTDDSVIPAGEFIEYAEEFGLAKLIDERIFRKGLDQLQGIGDGQTKIFFNVSSKTFSDEQRMRRLPTTLRELGLNPSQVVLEITEREALPHLNQLMRLVDDLRAQGLEFALDDFGSGFSSFMYLKYFNIDYVKIEGSFIRHMIHDPKDKIMVEHIHSMANEFGLRTIAEFVEDEETVEMLQEIGIDFAQGFHYGKPKERI